jgi:predicted RNase H-like HicB family nuclease
MHVPFDSVIFREGKVFVAHCRELDVSSCGDTVEEARRNLKTAVRLFLEEAKKLRSAGMSREQYFRLLQEI